jgi:prepilin-type N-terminal cleavage/methylation domain-containing protein
VRRAFTLLELMLVVVILGVIAALAIPRASQAQERARYTSTFASIRGIVAAACSYRAVWKELPGDVKEGVAPPGMASFLDPRIWTRVPPVGGKYDWNNTVHASDWSVVTYWVGHPPNAGVTRASGDNATHARLIAMDRMLDDDSATTGRLRRLSGSLYFPVFD